MGSKVSSITASADQDGCYSVEFFDVRDAERYRMKLEKMPRESSVQPVPPGLEPPPGLLEAATHQNPPDVCLKIEPPPGLEATVESASDTSTTASSPRRPSVVVVI